MGLKVCIAGDLITNVAIDQESQPQLLRLKSLQLQLLRPRAYNHNYYDLKSLQPQLLRLKSP